MIEKKHIAPTHVLMGFYKDIPLNIKDDILINGYIYFEPDENGKFERDLEFEKQLKELKEKEMQINNLKSEISNLKEINEEQSAIINTYIVKLVQNSSHFSNAEKETLWLIVDNFDEATLKEIELNKILYPDELNLANWKTGTNYSVDDKVIYENNIYKVIQNHESRTNWLPSQVPALYKLIGQKKQSGQIKDWIQPTGGHDAYNIGDLVKFNDKIYKSMINGNVWSPTAYPQGWEEV